ncbi:benzoate/H(+) symporter BenE family transporter [Leucobacter sp. UT-8R-CII-1-4]|uniref:benzoate/H(+) symporter BenE family transporter n=1 Tax=Leucobacter sp. UT-8R-CII-1-4 TaxID=3040075 RepID=UPI0024A92ED0|nr:benzoate/H(+) symporter BenE family transporter [Leucobacter sp. UT-8R-CII-1-4]MDI6023603.1 benzoate/H(+) symporter BenE family transporter [Leucobacter sp. UT-8R-CII-1-4]
MSRTDAKTRPPTHLLVPVTAGLVCALVGFTAAFAVVLGGLQAVGATPRQAASGLLAVTITMGIASVLLSWRFRMPITSAWSTPGAALLLSTGMVAGGWPAAIGAFVCCGVLLTVTGLWPGLAKLVQRIPVPLAQAMLAGILLPLCIAPVTSLASHPLSVLPIVLTWLVMTKLAPKWAVPAALAVALVVILIHLSNNGNAPAASAFIPVAEWTTPTFTIQALTGIALPLYIVTMASQNIPGVAVMAGFGYQVPWRPALVATGFGSIVSAPFGGHAINLAAISAALAAGPEAGRKEQRWIAGITAGVAYIVLGLTSTGLAAAVLAAPPEIMQTVAGIALFGAFAAACASAMADPALRLPAAVTMLVAASGVQIAGLSSAFWALLAGCLIAVAISPWRKLRKASTVHAATTANETSSG